MQRRSPERDVIAATPYRPPTAPATRKGGPRLRGHVAAAGGLVGLSVAAGVALTSMTTAPRVEVGFSAPAAQAPADVRLIVDRSARQVRLVRDGAVLWRARCPIDCVTGRRVESVADGAELVARACVRLRDGAVVGLGGRVPDGAEIDVR